MYTVQWTVHLYTGSDTWVERTEACHVMRGTDKEILGTREIFALFLSESLMYYLQLLALPFSFLFSMCCLILHIYRVSQKNAILCLMGHRGHQEWTRDKSRLSFEYLRKFPF